MQKKEKCAFCRKEAETRGIVDNQLLWLCKSCAFRHNAIIAEKPSTEQLAEIERPYTIRERLVKIRGLDVSEKPEEKRKKEITLDYLRKIKKEKAREKKQEGKVKEMGETGEKKLSIKLVDKFSELVKRARNARNMTQAELAATIAEPEQAIVEIEKGIFPREKRIIKKLEQFLKIKLQKEKQEEEKPEQAEQAEIDFRSKKLKIDDLLKLKEKREEKQE